MNHDITASPSFKASFKMLKPLPEVPSGDCSPMAGLVPERSSQNPLLFKVPDGNGVLVEESDEGSQSQSRSSRVPSLEGLEKALSESCLINDVDDNNVSESSTAHDEVGANGGERGGGAAREGDGPEPVEEPSSARSDSAMRSMSAGPTMPDRLMRRRSSVSAPHSGNNTARSLAGGEGPGGGGGGGAGGGGGGGGALSSRRRSSLNSLEDNLERRGSLGSQPPALSRRSSLGGGGSFKSGEKAEDNVGSQSISRFGSSKIAAARAALQQGASFRGSMKRSNSSSSNTTPADELCEDGRLRGIVMRTQSSAGGGLGLRTNSTSSQDSSQSKGRNRRSSVGGSEPASAQQSSSEPVEPLSNNSPVAAPGSIDPSTFVKLKSDDPAVAEEAAHRLANFCDLFVVGLDKVDMNREKAGKMPDLWESLETMLGKSQMRQPSSSAVGWCCTAVGFICFGNVDNCYNASKNIKVLDALANLMVTGHESERVAATAAVANICSIGNLGMRLMRTGSFRRNEEQSKAQVASHDLILNSLTTLCREKGEIQGRAVGALANMSRSESAKQVMLNNQLVVRTLEAIKDEAEAVEDRSDAQDVLAARATMALASLKGREELEENRVHPTSNTLMTIVKCLEMAMKKDKKMYGGVMWTVSMVLQPLYELSIADTHKVEMVVSGVAVPLLRFVCEWSEGTSTHDLELALLTLQQLSFDPDCRSEIAAMVYHPEDQTDLEELPDNSQEALESLVEIDPPSGMDKTRDTGGSIGLLCKNLLSQLSQADMEDHELYANLQETDKNKWIMISYNWDVQEQCKELAERLQEEGFNVWMDILDGCMGGDTLEAMAEAVSKAGVVLMFVTLKYKESANCRREASYANDLKKPIIPIIMEQDYKPDGSWGWLGLIIAGKLYYNLSDWEHNEDQIGELLRAPELGSLPRISRSTSSRPRPGYQAPPPPLTGLTGAHDGSNRSLERVDSDLGMSTQVTQRGALLRAKSTRRASLISEGATSPLASSPSISAIASAKMLAARRSSVRRLSAEGGLKNKEISSTFNGLPTAAKTGPILKQSASDAKMQPHRSASARSMEEGPPRTESGIRATIRSRMAERTASRKSLTSDGGTLVKAKLESDVHQRSSDQLHGSTTESPRRMLPSASGRGRGSNASLMSTLSADNGELSEVDSWLASINGEMLQHVSIFANHRLTTLEMIAELTPQDMERDIEPCIPAVGHRVMLRMAIDRLRQELAEDTRRKKSRMCIVS